MKKQQQPQQQQQQQPDAIAPPGKRKEKGGQFIAPKFTPRTTTFSLGLTSHEAQKTKEHNEQVTALNRFNEVRDTKKMGSYISFRCNYHTIQWRPVTHHTHTPIILIIIFKKTRFRDIEITIAS